MRTILLITLLAVDGIYGAAQQPELLSPTCTSGTPCQVGTEYGEFVFNAHLDRERRIGSLKGQIVNNTSKDWVGLTFRVTYYDWMGASIETVRDTIHVGSLKQGESYSMGMGRGESILLKDPDRVSGISRFSFSLADGTISASASYTFVLLNEAPTESAHPRVLESTRLARSDDATDFAFTISKAQLGFVLRNKSDQPIQIDWNQVAYVDVTGESHKVIHAGVKYIDRDKTLAPTTVPPSAHIKDTIFPADYVHYTGGEFGGWMEDPLFPNGKAADSYKGKTFVVFIPLKVGSSQRTYTFKFKIADVQL